jgi:cytochrome c-type biogenesis protein CcmH/NrfG
MRAHDTNKDPMTICGREKLVLSVRRELLICLALVGVIFAVYWPASQCHFVAYDDLEYVANNPHVTPGLTWVGIGWAFSHVTVSTWNPVTTLSHMLVCQFFGLAPGAHHLVNLGFHAANAALLFLVLIRMTGAIWRSAMVAGLFALHPLHVESVAWISERKDVLSTFFFMLTLFAYVWAKGDCNGQERDRRGYYVLSLILFMLGLLSKPMLVTVPFVLLLLDFWPLRRVSNQQGQPEVHGHKVSAVWPLFREKLPFFALSVLFCFITWIIQRSGGAMESAAKISPGARMANALVSCFEYLVKTVWPVRLAVIYPHPALQYRSFWEAWPAWEVTLIASLLLLISGACLVSARSRPWLVVGWFWYLVMLAPVIGLVQVGTQAMADRYTYLPLIGIFVIVVWGSAEVARRFQTTKNAKYAKGDGVKASERGERGLASEPGRVSTRACQFIFAAVILICCAVVTRYQLGFWRSTTTLFEHALAVTADNVPARSLFALGLEADGRIEEAINNYRVVARIDPAFHHHLALLLSRQQKWEQAAAQYRAVLVGSPKDVKAQLGLADMLSHLGQQQAAVSHLEASLQLDPDCIQGLNNLAWIKATASDGTLRNGEQAVQLAERACRLTHYEQAVFVGTLAAAYAEAGRFEEAIATAQKACDLATQQGDQALASKNLELLSLYREHHSYVEPGK